MFNNKKRNISKYFLFSLLVICLIFTSSGFDIGHSCAVELNESSDEMGLELNAQDTLDSQNNDDILEVNSNENDMLGETRTLNGGSYRDIQTAVNAAHAGDTIKLSGTFYSSSKQDTIVVNKQLTFTSDSQATLDGQGLSSAFCLYENAKKSTFSNLKFINGLGSYAGGGMLINAKDVVVENCVFENNYAKHGGGGLSTAYDAVTSTNVVVRNCHFYKNSAGVSAGALALFGDNSRFENCYFDSNYVYNNNGEDVYGGAVQLSMDDVPCVAYAINSTFVNNWAFSNAHSHGGAGCIRDGVSYIGCTFSNNSAIEGGALTYHASGTIRDCIFNENNARIYGGAISTGFLYNSTMVLKILNCKFNGNSAPEGGAVQLNGLNILIEDSEFSSNFASKNGGAINIYAKTVKLNGDVFYDNSAEIYGGAVFIKGTDTIIKDSTFDSNHAIPDHDKIDDGLGGAVYVDSRNAEILNNIFKLNTARNGSAVYYDKKGINLKLTNNVMHKNQAWVYALPISAHDIFYGDKENISVVIHGGNNIARYGNLAVSNAIYNAAISEYINVDGFNPLDGATNTGELYQDDREYNIDILLTVQHEDGTTVYNDTLKSSYLGEVNALLKDLKPGKYYVNAEHFEDTYYKGITNVTSFTVYPKVDNQIKISPDRRIYNFEDVVVWTIDVTNNGPNNATEVVVSNLLPEGLVYFTDNSGKLYDPKTGILNVSTLDVGEKLSFNIITVVNKTGEILNKANITAHELDINPTNNYDEQSISVNPAADIMVVKSVNDTIPDYYDLVNWTITVRNNGPDMAHNISVQDIIPGSLVLINFTRNYDSKKGTWKIESIGVGQEVKFNVITRVMDTGLIENNANAYAAEYDYDLANNRDNEIIKVNPSADLSIIKTVNSTPVNYQDYVKWTLVIKNNGPDNATGVKITDVLPEGFTLINSTFNYEDDTIEIDDLAVGQVISIDIICKVDITGNYTNLANISGNQHDYNLTNNLDNVSITVNPACDLEISKSVNESEPKYGQLISWTITVKNNGPDIAHDINVSDILPDSLIWVDDDSLLDYNPQTGIWNIEILDFDEEISLEIVCRVNKTGFIANNVNVTSREYDHNLTNNEDNESIEVEPTADVNIIKLVNNTNPNYNDLIKWTIIVSNNGPDKATSVEVQEKLPDGLILINSTPSKGIYDDEVWWVCCLEKGEIETLDIVCRVNKTGNFTNNVTIKAEEYDPNSTNNNANESIEVPPAVDIEVIQKVSNPSPLFGDTIVWMITVKNNGPDNATGVELLDLLPESLIFCNYSSTKGEYSEDVWNVGELDVGSIEYINITCITNALGTVINEALATSLEYDWNESNNHDDAEINVLPVSDLAVEKFVDKINPNYRDIITWTLRVSNMGPNDASGVVVEDCLPSGLEFIKSSDDVSYNGGIWNIGVLKIGQVKELVIKCRIVSTGMIKNTANVWADNYDPNLDNNHAERMISVAPASDLAITKIASKYKYVVGDLISYVIEVVNNGPDTAYNIKINEILDVLLKIKSFKVSKGKFNKFTNVWTIDSLEYGQSARLCIKAVAIGDGIIKNKVSVTSDSFDYDMSNNQDLAIVKVVKKPFNKSSDIPKDNKLGNDNVKLSNLENHPTANPIALLIQSLAFSIIIFRKQYFKENIN